MPAPRPSLRRPARVLLTTSALLGLALSPAAVADVVVPDDQVVQGSLCLGFDCADGESFGLDTLRLKENNTQIAFDDTTVSAGFAANDWSLQANDSGAGGLNRFMLRDVTGGRVPFGVMAGSPADSLAVSATGDVGLGTGTPVKALQLTRGDTPTVRLEQTAAGGLTPQTWDVGANEANFFVRDASGSSRLPLRIRPGAPTSSLDIAPSGRVGIGGNPSPDATLHVRRGDASAQLLVEETNATTAARTMAVLRNNGAAGLRLENTATDAVDWQVGGGDGDAFAVAPVGGARPALTLQPAGSLAVSGILRQRADAAVTEAPGTVDGAAVLAALKTLPIGTLQYTGDPTDATHLTPSPAAFRAAFSLGSGDAEIAPSDMAAVALVAVKALADSGPGTPGQPGDTGPRGDKGDKGDMGAAGPAGATGPAGRDGAAGTAGPAGAGGAGVNAADLRALLKRVTVVERSAKTLRARNTKLDRRVKALERRLKAAG